jgi:hypothetical protein
LIIPPGTPQSMGHAPTQLPQGIRLIGRLDLHRDAELFGEWVESIKLWRQKAERRLGEIKSGKVAGIPAEKVIRKARSSLR